MIFFRFPYNFAIEVSPLFQTTPVSTKKITVEGMGVFFLPIFDKEWKGKREGREKRKERAVEHQLTTSRSSSWGSFLSGYQRTTCTYLNFLREYQLLTYSLDFTITKLGSMRLVSFISCGGRKRRLDDTDATVVISDATNMKIAARKAALQNLRS